MNSYRRVAQEDGCHGYDGSIFNGLDMIRYGSRRAAVNTILPQGPPPELPALQALAHSQHKVLPEPTRETRWKSDMGTV